MNKDFPHARMTEAELDRHAVQMVEVLELAGYDLDGAKSLVNRMGAILKATSIFEWRQGAKANSRIKE